eukprot:1714743-Pyramimonas_sp.AAC.1
MARSEKRRCPPQRYFEQRIGRPGQPTHALGPSLQVQASEQWQKTSALEEASGNSNASVAWGKDARALGQADGG